MKLTGKIALVTGGSRGIGFAIAKILSENGALVVITSKDSEKIKKAEAQITNSFGITCDIKKKSEVQNVLNQTIEKLEPTCSDLPKMLRYSDSQIWK